MLFSYGTLQQSEVQRANFGRELVGHADTLTGYVLGTLKIHDARVIRESGSNMHPILRYTGKASDTIAGTVFELSEEELAQADSYEVDDYERVEAVLQSGTRCWIYAAREART